MLDEIRQELLDLSRKQLIDSVLAPIAFVAGNALGGVAAGAVAAASVLLVTIGYRLARRQTLRYAFGGTVGSAIAIAWALRSGEATDYFLPAIVGAAATAIVFFISVLVRRPALGFISAAVRGWPIEWFWHPQVRPAYSETTMAWALFLGGRAWFQYGFVEQGELAALTIVKLGTGWPATIAMLIGVYVYGRRRLERLAGPSTEEFIAGSPPPWKGQDHGF